MTVFFGHMTVPVFRLVRDIQKKRKKSVGHMTLVSGSYDPPACMSKVLPGESYDSPGSLSVRVI